MKRSVKKLKKVINLLGRDKRKGRSDRTKKGKFGKIGLAFSFVIVALTPSFSSLINDSIGVSEPRLAHVGGIPTTPILEIDERSTDRHLLYITLRPIFKNTAFKSGHVESAKISVDGLKDSPEQVQLVYLDRSELGWWEKKEIRCEFLVTINPEMISLHPTQLTFRVQFYGPKGNELYWEVVEIEGWKSPRKAILTDIKA
jgi:hypothetical protein